MSINFLCGNDSPTSGGQTPTNLKTKAREQIITDLLEVAGTSNIKKTNTFTQTIVID